MRRPMAFSHTYQASLVLYAGSIPLAASFRPLMTGRIRHVAPTSRSGTSQSFDALSKRGDMVSGRFFCSIFMKAFP